MRRCLFAAVARHALQVRAWLRGLGRAPAALVAAAALVAGCGGGEDPAPAPDRPPAGATVGNERRVAPRIVDLTVRSPAVGEDVNVRLLTPTGWSKDGDRSWPVLYLLHGCCDTYDSWTRETDVEDLPALRKVLVVMPGGGEVGFYSDWLDGPGWETFHLRELRELLERDYGAGTPRAIAGLSMGGLGAMDYAARHPGMFDAAASFSGVLHPLANADAYYGLVGQYTNPDDLWGDPGQDRGAWERHDPTELAGRLRGVRLFVSSGDGRPGPFEESGMQPDPIEQSVYAESRAFVGRLRRLDIPVQADFYGPGIHDWPYWERELHRALPLLRRGFAG